MNLRKKKQNPAEIDREEETETQKLRKNRRNPNVQQNEREEKRGEWFYYVTEDDVDEILFLLGAM